MRAIVLSLLMSSTVLVVPLAGQAATEISYRPTTEQQVLTLLNQIRRQNGLGTLTLSLPLRDAARAHSVDMLRSGYFGHDSASETWDARVLRSVKSPLIGENIAWGKGAGATPAGIVSQWMRSPAHRATILTAGFHRVGLGLAAGTFAGAPAVMATADFAA